MVPAERGKILGHMASGIRERADELARLETLYSGKPKAIVSRRGVALRYCEYYAGVADTILGKTIPVRPNILYYTLREPLGVTTHIVPWNYPIQIVLRSIAPALAAGSAVVLNPAEEIPTTALKVPRLHTKPGCRTGPSTWSRATGRRRVPPSPPTRA